MAGEMVPHGSTSVGPQSCQTGTNRNPLLVGFVCLLRVAGVQHAARRFVEREGLMGVLLPQRPHGLSHRYPVDIRGRVLDLFLTLEPAPQGHPHALLDIVAHAGGFRPGDASNNAGNELTVSTDQLLDGVFPGRHADSFVQRLRCAFKGRAAPQILVQMSKP